MKYVRGYDRRENIQIVMGWKDNHFHEFVIGKNRYTENPRSKEDVKPGGMFRLVDLLKQKGRAFSYVYDFGDQWEHEIILEDSRYFNSALFKIVEFLNLVIMISADIIHSNQWRCRHVMQSFQQTQGR